MTLIIARSCASLKFLLADTATAIPSTNQKNSGVANAIAKIISLGQNFTVAFAGNCDEALGCFLKLEEILEPSKVRTKQGTRHTARVQFSKP
jgi:hypothetical protein